MFLYLRLFAAILLLSPLSLAAQADPNKRPEGKIEASIIPPKPVKRVPPKYPPDAARRWLEGWVDLRFVVEADGSISDIFVEEASAGEIFEEASITAVKKWEYEPATIHGKPVRYENTEVRLTFQLEDFSENADNRGARRKFRQAAKKIDKALKENELEKAKQLIDELKAKENTNLYEVSHLFARSFRYHLRKNEPRLALRDLNRAIKSEGAYIEKKAYKGFLVPKFLLESHLTYYKAALETYKLLEKHDLLQEGDRASTTIKEVQKVLAGSSPFRVKGFIDPECNCGTNEERFWFYQPIRRHIGFEKISGTVSRLVVRCELKTLEAEVDPDWEYKIPENWGACSVYVYGTEGTRFNMIEIPPESS